MKIEIFQNIQINTWATCGTVVRLTVYLSNIGYVGFATENLKKLLFIIVNVAFH